MSTAQLWRDVQQLLGIDVDGKPGKQTATAVLAKLRPSGGESDSDWHEVKASSFADPADIASFKRCKKRGGTDQQCFKVGDNGIGKWGDDTTVDRPMCALPREDWAEFGNAARGRRVEVKANGKTVIAELRDTMPARRFIKNGAGIDLNPAACAALGLRPPIMTAAAWRWA